MPGHQRNVSQQKPLIDEEECEEKSCPYEQKPTTSRTTAIELNEIEVKEAELPTHNVSERVRSAIPSHVRHHSIHVDQPQSHRTGFGRSGHLPKSSAIGSSASAAPALNRQDSDADSEMRMAFANDFMKFEQRHNLPWYRHPKIARHTKLILGSVSLFVVGISLIVFGIHQMVVDEPMVVGWVFIFAGVICFVPGSYHVTYILCSIIGRPGWTLEGLSTAK